MTDTPTPTETEPTDTDQVQEGAEQTTEEVKTFTQEELEAVIGKRLAAERKKYADYDQLKAAAGKLSEIEKSQLSEVERAQADANEWKTKYEEAVASVRKAEVTAAVAAANTTSLSTEYLVRILDVTDPAEAADAVNAFLADNPSLRKGPEKPQVPASPGASKTGKADIDPTASVEDFEAFVKATFGG